MKGRLFGATDFPYLCTRHGILRVKRIRLIGTSVIQNQFQPSPEILFKRTPLYIYKSIVRGDRLFIAPCSGRQVDISKGHGGGKEKFGRQSAQFCLRRLSGADFADI